LLWSNLCKQAAPAAQVAWQEGFPFNVVSHPQYVGAVLTIAGLLALSLGQAPNGTFTLAVYWCLLYAITAVCEQFL
jgi:methylene-fatty-acyl-phospholipid synthase